MSDSFFSERAFVEVWCRHQGNGSRPFRVTVPGMRPPHELFATAQVARVVKKVSFGPAAHAGLDGEGTLDEELAFRLLAQLRGPRVREFSWHVRYDQPALAAWLERRGFVVQASTTHVLPLAGGHEATFADYAESLRNHVRKGRKRCVVEISESAGDFEEYWAIHEGLIELKGNYQHLSPKGLVLALARMRDQCRFIVAKVDGRIAGGALFARHGSSVSYFHGANARAYTNCYPSAAVLDAGIAWAYAVGAKTFNFGHSAGVKSLEAYKKSWGAKPAEDWAFTWRSPVWERVEKIKARLRAR